MGGVRREKIFEVSRNLKYGLEISAGMRYLLSFHWEKERASIVVHETVGLFREKNPGLLVPKTRIIPLDQTADVCALQNTSSIHLLDEMKGR